jgi:hypothetical protein
VVAQELDVGTGIGHWRARRRRAGDAAALVVAGRLQGRNLATGEAGPSPATRGTGGIDATPVASRLAVAARVALPGPAVFVAVGEGAVWVLLEQGGLLRVDPDRHQVTGRLELGASGGGRTVGPLVVGAGAVWVGTREATMTARIDPVRLRVTARFPGHVFAVARGMLWSFCCRRGDKVMGFGRIDARTLRPRPPLLIKDTTGRRQPAGWFAVGADAVYTVAWGDQRLWRVPLVGGPARAVARVGGFRYGLAADAGAVWVLSGTGEPGGGRDRSGRCGAWRSAPARSPRPPSCRTWMLARSTPRSGLWLATAWSGWPARTRAGCSVAGSCCGSMPPLGGWPGGFATRAGSSGRCWPPVRARRG